MSGITMSGSLGSAEQPPLDIVKVEEEDDDGAEGLDPDTVTVGRGNEADIDVELLKTVASQLSCGPWLSCGSEGGKRLGRKLLDLGEKLEGWKKWEPLCRSKGEELRDVREQLKESELRLEVMKGNKAELRKTYDLEVERRIKAEREVAELKKKAGEGMVSPVMNEVGVQTEACSDSESSIVVLKGSEPQAPPVAGVEVVDAPIAVIPNSTPSLPGTPYNLRRRSGRVIGRNAHEEQVELAVEGNHDAGDVADHGAESSSRQRSRSKRRIPILARGSSRSTGQSGIVQTNENEINLKEAEGGTPNSEEMRGRYSCFVCSKRFLHKSNFVQHMKTHPKEQSYRCKTCGKNSKNRKNFRAHLKTHDANRDKKHACPTCSIRVFTLYSLERHMVTHRPEKPFKCPQCPKRFKLAYLVNIHLATHSNLKPFRCELCEKSFKHSGHLVRHLRIHTGERPHSCQICNKTFADSSALGRHVKIHQGDQGKPHQCPFCDMKFFRKSNCQIHQKRRHKTELASLAQPEIRG